MIIATEQLKTAYALRAASPFRGGAICLCVARRQVRTRSSRGNTTAKMVLGARFVKLSRFR